ncbi:hypothetical protein QYE76_067015 [Lolium multiflorum]|uniref:Uncharacterized protein n=1 Tax=Lolium multiflorum TaxID=4521 RepID=A0AAD8SC04_LOLMU|nr:hypothetical protein QYE76_067015 [Lolium multiflorum]
MYVQLQPKLLWIFLGAFVAMRHIGPSAQVVWPIVGQEILNGGVGGGFRGIQITSGFIQLWRAFGITSELQLYCTAIGALIRKGGSWQRGKMLKSELFWNASVVFEKVPMRNRRGYLDIVLKRIATIHPDN